jgi:hypothetical protein
MFFPILSARELTFPDQAATRSTAHQEHIMPGRYRRISERYCTIQSERNVLVVLLRNSGVFSRGMLVYLDFLEKKSGKTRSLNFINSFLSSSFLLCLSSFLRYILPLFSPFPFFLFFFLFPIFFFFFFLKNYSEVVFFRVDMGPCRANKQIRAVLYVQAAWKHLKTARSAELG